MKFAATPIPGVVVVTAEPAEDERGVFARTFCAAEFAAHGLILPVVQCNTSWNRRRGTLRGLHHQAEPHAEPKLVRCTQGRVWDVAVDLRRDSPAFRGWFGVELSAAARNALYVPAGCAHGFLTREDGCEVFYQMGESYRPELARGVRWNDPAFAIAWPFAPEVISERDAGYADFTH